MHESLSSLQIFMGIVTATFLILSAQQFGATPGARGARDTPSRKPNG